jgi:ribosomal protein S18 acetylase RimI-like enzyme
MTRLAFRIERFSREHAAPAAEIHAEGQAGTFLTRLGPAFLTALYAQMADSSACFGFVALTSDREVLGVVVGTVDSGRLFKELIRARGLALAPAACLALVRDPSLLHHVIETLRRPDAEGARAGEAELLFIGVRSGVRGQGLGRALFESLAVELERRGLKEMGLVVDDANADAQRFYQRCGMQPVRSLVMYERVMYWYRLSLVSRRERAGHPCGPEPVGQARYD